MDFITICGREVATLEIVTIEKRRCNLNCGYDEYEVYVTLSSGGVLQAFRATESACNDYVIALRTAIGGVSKPAPVVNWVGIRPNNVEVEKGKVTHVEMLWNGAETETALFSYSSENESVADFVLGEILGVEVGATRVQGTKDGKNTKANVTVVPSKDGIMFEHLGTVLNVGNSVMIPLRNNGVMIPWGDLILLSSDPTVATITSRGQIDALKVGTTLIIAKYKGNRYGAFINVTAASVVSEESTPKKKTRSKKVDKE